MVESFQRTVEQDGQGYCVVASDLMRYLTIKATQAERTIWKKKKSLPNERVDCSICVLQC